MSALLALVTLCACGYTQTEYAEDLAEAKCALYDQCEKLNTAGYTDIGTCIADEQVLVEQQLESCTSFDSQEANSCVETWTSMDCDQLLDSTQHPGCDVCEITDTDTGS